jgi:uncharacterized protein
MRNDLNLLPTAKQRELERIVEVIFDEFRGATENATGPRKGARILKIILFGSHARGDWVDAPLSANQYKSDYDILIVVSQKELADRAAYWAKAEERLIRAYTIEKTLYTPVNFIVHSLHEVNDGLAHGRVFFMELAKDGIALYEAEDRDLATPKPKTPQQGLVAAKEYFDEWMPLAASSQKIYLFCISQHEYRDAAFNLHQATERLYACLLLTLTFYTPYNHNIAFLRSLAETERGLYQGALLKALQDQRGRTDLACHARRRTRTRRPSGLHRQDRRTRKGRGTKIEAAHWAACPNSSILAQSLCGMERLAAIPRNVLPASCRSDR